MRIAFFYPSSSVWSPINPNKIWTDARGLTGSELALFMYALHLSRRGHGVTIFSNFTNIGDIEKITCTHYHEWESIYKDQKWDALCSWMTPEPLKSAQPHQFRFFNQQVSDFGMCEPGWESYVDILAPLSNSHAAFLRPQTNYPQEQFRILHNGVDLEDFRPQEKISGKLVWASSHDRGLHWLLELFPKLKEIVPHVELHIFYNMIGVDSFAAIDEEADPQWKRELGFRSRYVKEALHRLDGKGVVVHNSVSRKQIKEHMATAEVLPYPCDPVRYTETFGVTVLEACAAEAVPVICTADAFGELWGQSTVNIGPPYAHHKDEYLELLVKTLTNKEFRLSRRIECGYHAKQFSWDTLASKLELCLETRGELGLPKVK